MLSLHWLKKINKFILSVAVAVAVMLFYSADVFSQSVPVGTPVMEPGLNAYISDKSDSDFKLLANTGFVNAKYELVPLSNADFPELGYYSQNDAKFFNIGAALLYSGLGYVEPGLSLNIGLDGKDRNLKRLNAELRFPLSWLYFMEPFYIKFLAGYCSMNNVLRLSNSLLYINESGFNYGAAFGFQIISYGRLIINTELLYSKTSAGSISVSKNNLTLDITQSNRGFSLFNAMFSVGWFL